MSQQQILDLFRESPRTWYSCRDVATYLELTFSKASRHLKQLRKYECIEYKKSGVEYNACWLYRHKKIRRKCK